MANITIPFDPDSEEFKEYLKKLQEEMARAYNIPPAIWGHKTSISGYWIGEEEYIEPTIPLEQNEYGVYGYKTLVRFPESPWFWSPNRYFNSEWVNNHLTAHKSPDREQDVGIYATKDLESLKEWYEGYENMMGGRVYNFSMVRCYAVKIRVWGVVVEHTKGFRCEHAEIIGVIKDGHW